MNSSAPKIKTILWSILFFNWLVAIAKIIVGLIFNVMSMVADGLHSFSDGTSNIIGLVGITAAAKPVDDDHPYGHKKIETFTALGIILLLLIVCYEMIEATIKRISHPQAPEANWLTFAVMFVTIFINIVITVYEYKKGRELKSDILVADSLHTRTDIFASLAVIITLVSIRLGYPFFDIISSFVIVGLILIAVFNILRHVFNILVDHMAIDKEKVCEIVLAYPQVKKCHKIRTRGREDDIHVDLHIGVYPAMSVEDSHRLSHLLQEALKQQIPGVTDVIIHIEPFSQ